MSNKVIQNEEELVKFKTELSNVKNENCKQTCLLDASWALFEKSVVYLTKS